MKCDECGGRVTKRHAMRRYDVGGLPHVELHGVAATRCSGCGAEGLSIPRVLQLNRVLADHFVKQVRMLAPVEVRFLRKFVGLSTNEFAQRMGVTRETVSRWETGSTPMGPSADRLLRLMVLTHEPSDNYSVDDLLKELTDAPAPASPPVLAMRTGKEGVWRPGRQLASA